MPNYKEIVHGKLSIDMIQRNLNVLNYDCGNVDGVAGQKTEVAVKSFQKNNGLEEDGIVGVNTESKLIDEVEKLQRNLTVLNYDCGIIDGICGWKTEDALRKFQRDSGLKADAVAGPNTAKVISDKIKNIQNKLNSLNYNGGNADGVYGPKTEDALLRFQKDKGLKVDGIVGQETSKALFGNNADGNTNGGSPSSGEDLYWLSRIVEAESKGEKYEGKLAVANVIINRKKSGKYPKTIYGVIFDCKGHNTCQFEPVSNRTINNKPSQESISAAQEALNGNNNIGDCLFFLNPKKAQSNWITRNRTYVTTIGNHQFYK